MAAFHKARTWKITDRQRSQPKAVFTITGSAHRSHSAPLDHYTGTSISKEAHRDTVLTGRPVVPGAPHLAFEMWDQYERSKFFSMDERQAKRIVADGLGNSKYTVAGPRRLMFADNADYRRSQQGATAWRIRFSIHVEYLEGRHTDRFHKRRARSSYCAVEESSQRQSQLWLF